MDEPSLSQSGHTALEVASQALKEAGTIVLSRFLKGDKVKLKGNHNIVTETDLLSERTIINFIKKEFPAYRILSEESEAIITDSPFTWVIDPLDGSNNFSSGIPFFCLTAALVRGDEVLLGLIYDPLRKELFGAEKGRGAFLNQRPISTSSKTDLDRAIIVFDLGYDPIRGAEMLHFAHRLWASVLSLRILGSGALGLAYVAAGRVDLYLHRCLFPWDIVSGSLLVREAGGEITDWERKPLTLKTKDVVAGNKFLHQEFMKWLSQL